MKAIITVFLLIFSSSSFAEDIALTVEQYDMLRNRAEISLLDSTQVPIGTVLRIHSKTGTCQVRITERVNNSLIGITEGCEAGIINPGMKLAYSPTPEWSAPIVSYEAPTQSTWDLKDRISLYIGHNLSRQLEGKVIANGSVKNLEGDTALSMGLNGRVYDFSPRVSLGVGLGYETPRTFDRATFSNNGVETKSGTIGYSPRLSIWSLSAQAEVNIIERLIGFGGMNISIPQLSNSPFDMTGDLGFQAGANYEVYPQVGIEALIKIQNMNLKNNIGETTDVSLAGLEVRGRYRF